MIVKKYSKNLFKKEIKERNTHMDLGGTVANEEAIGGN